MAIVPKGSLAFAINDSLTVDENIVAFTKELKNVDRQLAVELASSLVDFSNEIRINPGLLLDALYSATAAVETAKGVGGASDKGVAK